MDKLGRYSAEHDFQPKLHNEDTFHFMVIPHHMPATGEILVIITYGPRPEKPYFIACKQQRARSACLSVQSNHYL